MFPSLCANETSGGMFNSTCFNATVATEATSRDRPPWYWTLRVLFAVVAAVGNGLVIYLNGSRPQLRQQASPNWFFLSLAAADFGVGLFATPSHMICLFRSGGCSKFTWDVLLFITEIFLTASVTNLVLLTLDCYLSVIYPYIHPTLTRPRMCAVAIAVAWFVAFTIEVPYRLLDVNTSGMYAYLVTYTLLVTVLPNVFMIYAYIRIIIVVKQHRNRIKTQELQVSSNNSSTDQPPSRTAHARTRNRHGGLAAVGVVVGFFLMYSCVYQYHLTCIIMPNCSLSKTFLLIIVLLRYLNSAPNFFVYLLLKAEFRRELRSLFRCS